jgi:hypothetical protein
MMQMPDGRMIVRSPSSRPSLPRARDRSVGLSIGRAIALAAADCSRVDGRRSLFFFFRVHHRADPPRASSSSPRSNLKSCSSARARTRPRGKGSSSRTSTRAWRSWTPSAPPWCASPPNDARDLRRARQPSFFAVFVFPADRPTTPPPPTPIARAGSPRARPARPRRQGRHHHLQRRSDDHEGAGRTRPSQPRATPRTTRRSRARGPPSRARAFDFTSRFSSGAGSTRFRTVEGFFFSSLSPRRDE